MRVWQVNGLIRQSESSGRNRGFDCQVSTGRKSIIQTMAQVAERKGGTMSLDKCVSVVKNAVADAARNHTMAFAAGLSYYFVLSLFPALIALSAVVGFLPIPNVFDQILALMSGFVPADSMGLVRQIVADTMNSHRGELLSFGLIGALWSASSGFAGLIEALNVAYNVPETRPFWKTRGLAMLMTVMTGGLLLVALAVMVLGPNFGAWLAGELHLSFLWAHIWPVLRWCVSVAFVVAAVESMYFIGPNVKQHFGHTLSGAVFAVAAWLALSFALGIYFQRFAGLNRTYGALGGVIALMTWLFWSWSVVLLGAGINGAAVKARGDGSLPLKQTPRRPVAPPVPESDIAA